MRSQNLEFCGKAFTLYHTIPTFNNALKDGFGKHSGKKEEMLVTSIFSFSHSVCYSMSRIVILANILFIFVVSKMLSIWSGPTFCPLVKGLTIIPAHQTAHHNTISI